MSSLRRYVTSDRADKGEDVTEGEKSMSWYAVHNLICKMLCKESGNGYLFANIFLTLEWNLMARSESCLSMYIANIQWQDDALLFYFAKSKRRPRGWEISTPLTYAFKSLWIFPVLALSKYLLVHPVVVTTEGKLFLGTSQYDHFMKIFHKIEKKII